MLARSLLVIAISQIVSFAIFHNSHSHKASYEKLSILQLFWINPQTADFIISNRLCNWRHTPRKIEKVSSENWEGDANFKVNVDGKWQSIFFFFFYEGVQLICNKRQLSTALLRSRWSGTDWARGSSSELNYVMLISHFIVARFKHGRVGCLQLSDFAIDIRALEAAVELKSCALDIKMWTSLRTKEGNFSIKMNEIQHFVNI